MDLQKEEKYLKWLRHRKSTMIAFSIQSLLLGMEYSLTFLTLWPYINELIKCKSPKLMYGIVSACYLSSGIICSLLLGSYIDKRRCVKTTVYIGNLLVVLGNLIYAVSISIAFLMIGRLIAGCGGLLRSVMIGEITRIYHPNELTPKYSLMGMMYALGFIVAPLVNFLFRSVNLSVGGVIINYLNFPSVFMAVLFLIFQMISFLSVHDLSKQYDVKEEMEVCDKITERYNALSSGVTNRQTSFSVLNQMFSNCDIVLLIASTFFCTYIITSIEIWLPLIVLQTLNSSMYNLNIVILGTGVTCVIACIVLTQINLTNKCNYILALVCMFAFVQMMVVLMLITAFPHNKKLIDALWVLFCLLFASQIIIEDVFLVNAFARMVSTSYQTFADSVRLSASRIGALIALTISALIYDWIIYVGLGYISVLLIGIVLYLLRHRYILNPRVVIK